MSRQAIESWIAAAAVAGLVVLLGAAMLAILLAVLVLGLVPADQLRPIPGMSAR